MGAKRGGGGGGELLSSVFFIFRPIRDHYGIIVNFQLYVPWSGFFDPMTVENCHARPPRHGQILTATPREGGGVETDILTDDN